MQIGRLEKPCLVYISICFSACVKVREVNREGYELIKSQTQRRYLFRIFDATSTIELSYGFNLLLYARFQRIQKLQRL